MFKSISNITSAVKDLAAIAGKEVQHQLTRATNATEGTTSYIATKAHSLREKYEANLSNRKSNKAEVVSEAPANVISIN